MPRQRQNEELVIETEGIEVPQEYVATSSVEEIDTVPSTPAVSLLPRNEDGGIKLRSIWDIVNDLSQPLPESLINSRRQGGTNIRFISWHNATRVLDRYAPGWTYEIKMLSHIKEKVVLIARISIPTIEGLIVREATGNEDDVTTSYGDPFSNSESMALRRAASKFGLGRYLYNS